MAELKNDRQGGEYPNQFEHDSRAQNAFTLHGLEENDIRSN